MNKEFHNFRCEFEFEGPTPSHVIPAGELTVRSSCSPEMAERILAIVREAQPIDCVEQYHDVSEEIVGLMLGEPSHRKADRVIFNGPATILFWDDGEKTVVKCRECVKEGCVFDFEDEPQICDSESYDPEKAVMAAMLKRLYPNFQDVLREALGDGDGR